MYLSIWIIFILSMKLIKAEYHIKDNDNPSYLYKEIDKINETSNQIQLNMTLNTMEGTLLYWFDKYLNQLIISLSDDPKEKMIIEFRGGKNDSSLFELCGCLPCKYKMINLTIILTKDLINIQCNKQPLKKYHYTSQIQINEVYPVIKTFDIFQSAIWLVNTPNHGEYYPNPRQLAGCIHEISFNGQPLNMTINGLEITTKCPITCTKNVCNSGVCYETFGTHPICDCTDTFLNGQYCNSSGINITSNWENYSNPVQIKFIKITWRTVSRHIFGIENKNISLAIQTEGNYIYILYEDRIKMFLSNQMISDIYQPNKNTSLYLFFNTTFIEIKFLQNNYTNTTMPVPKDLSNEHFTSISAPNRSAFIDFVYKFNQEEQWNPLRVKYIVGKYEAVSENISTDNYGRENVSETFSGTFDRGVIIGIGIGIGIAIAIRILIRLIIGIGIRFIIGFRIKFIIGFGFGIGFISGIGIRFIIGIGIKFIIEFGFGIGFGIIIETETAIAIVIVFIIEIAIEIANLIFNCK